ncbi:MAG: class I adenylate-forming enzyme family protein, partial [Haloarculaceae archaeon]
VTALSHGATLVLQERFDPAEALRLVEEESVTVLYGMANMARGLEAEADDLARSLESVRRAQLLAPSTLQERFETEYGVEKVVSGYGLTETCAICALASHEERATVRHETVGRPLPNVDVRIVDPETDLEVPPGEQGEIRLRARTLFREYYGKPERTAAAFDNRGYFRTGDVGRLDPQGRLLFEGRYKDMIKTGGINVSPTEVENALEIHEAVREAVVVGVPDPEKDEVVAAAVRPAGGREVDPGALRDYLRERLSSYKVPETIAVWEEDFPRTDTGKVRKDAVEDELHG